MTKVGYVAIAMPGSVNVVPDDSRPELRCLMVVFSSRGRVVSSWCGCADGGDGQPSEKRQSGSQGLLGNVVTYKHSVDVAETQSCEQRNFCGLRVGQERPVLQSPHLLYRVVGSLDEGETGAAGFVGRFGKTEMEWYR